MSGHEGQLLRMVVPFDVRPEQPLILVQKTLDMIGGYLHVHCTHTNVSLWFNFFPNLVPFNAAVNETSAEMCHSGLITTLLLSNAVRNQPHNQTAQLTPTKLQALQ